MIYFYKFWNFWNKKDSWCHLHWRKTLEYFCPKYKTIKRPFVFVWRLLYLALVFCKLPFFGNPDFALWTLKGVPAFENLGLFYFYKYFEPKFGTLECDNQELNRFFFWNQRSRISLKPSFDQNWRKLKIMTGTHFN